VERDYHLTPNESAVVPSIRYDVAEIVDGTTAAV